MQRIDCGGKFTYVFTPYAQPIAEVEDGETFEVVTEDAFVGALNSEEQNPEAIVPFFNPQTGPIFVRNTLPGDTVKISILSIEPRRNWGVSSIQGHFGALGCTKTMPLLIVRLKTVYISMTTEMASTFAEKIHCYTFRLCRLLERLQQPLQ